MEGIGGAFATSGDITAEISRMEGLKTQAIELEVDVSDANDDVAAFFGSGVWRRLCWCRCHHFGD